MDSNRVRSQVDSSAGPDSGSGCGWNQMNWLQVHAQVFRSLLRRKAGHADSGRAKSNNDLLAIKEDDSLHANNPGCDLLNFFHQSDPRPTPARSPCNAYLGWTATCIIGILGRSPQKNDHSDWIPLTGVKVIGK